MQSSESRPACVVVLGLPRSGTTLLTTLIDRHSRFHLFYEPWNASPRSRPAVPETLDAFRSQMLDRFAGTPISPSLVTGFKETTTNDETTQWALDSARSLARNRATRVIWIQRDPIHCLLSKLEGARRWWGHDDAALSRATLEAFLGDTRASHERLAGLVDDIGGALVRYENLAADPAATLGELMEGLGFELEEDQLAFHRAPLDRSRVMGDPSLIESPRPVSDEAMERRRREADENAALIDAVLEEPRNASLMKEIESHLATRPVVRYFEP
ncbi:MAG: sulfotransferase [Myxococcota bacterium]|jgi:class 3 adenylate cyclase|nr:sulfotransferase [Myxococcota bacterium]